MKILILDANEVVQSITVKDKFVFLIAEDGRVYHVDSTDGNMWKAKEPDFDNLCEEHRKLIKKELNQ